MDRRKSRLVAKRVQRVMWVTVGFAMLGYLGVMVLKDARYAMVVAACAVIPIGATAPTPLKGILRGAGLGLLAGVGIYVALTGSKVLHPEIVRRTIIVAVPGTTVLCTAVAAVFALLARARRERIEREWHE